MKEPAYGGNLIFPWQKVYLLMSGRFTSVGVMGIMGIMGVMGVMGVMGRVGGADTKKPVKRGGISPGFCGLFDRP